MGKKRVCTLRHSFRDMSKDLHRGEKPKSEHTTTTNNNNFVIWVKQWKYSTSNERLESKEKTFYGYLENRKMIKMCTWEVWETYRYRQGGKKEALPVRIFFLFGNTGLVHCFYFSTPFLSPAV